MLSDGYNYKYDVSLPRDQYYNIVEIMREMLGDKVMRIIGYGHLGDGECIKWRLPLSLDHHNSHYNLVYYLIPRHKYMIIENVIKVGLICLLHRYYV